MNNNYNNYNNNDYEKIITIKKNLYCTNCNKKGHLRKACHLQRRISI